jgi:Chitin synthase
MSIGPYETFHSWLTISRYFISHHLSKSFESVFGGVTCLPGCFSMYRIKAPKGGQNYWVPILANPDVVEHYSENVVDTLHKKNLLLLGEDRYLSTLMLKTFPKRKQVFVPQAVCKTTVPEKFRVLLSQRRRWINSTVHNLMELVLVRDLCGTFCFSMQFVVGIELVGTLVLPAAISFTVYVSKYTPTPAPHPPALLTLASHHLHHQETCPDHPLSPLGIDSWVTSSPHRHDSAPVVVCCLDVHISPLTANMEFRFPSLRVLEIRRL